eukprot:GHVN01034259.1.p1 GENE.GHVN01034259.1~~GHVN01034259.1.p1  ORF type:complete len:906 (+),score=132.48 GHVN01034259.1:358-2718(+)
MTDEEEVGGPPNPKTETVYHILAIVESAHQNNVLVKVVIPNNVSKDEHRKWTRMTSVARAITTSGFRWYAARVIALTTMFREYQALMSFPDILLKEFLLSEDLVDGGECIDESETGKKLKRGEKKKLRKKRQRLAAKKSLLEKKEREKLEVPDSLMHAMEALYNETQLAALKDCLKATGITLIQGPPGTGKTTTIMGVLSVILNSSVKPVSEGMGETQQSESPPPDGNEDDVSDDECQQRRQHHATDDSKQDGVKRRRLLQKAQPWLYNRGYEPWYDTIEMSTESVEVPPESMRVGGAGSRTANSDEFLSVANVVDESQPRRVLVCAPSNAAIDEILKRLTRPPSAGGGVFDSEGNRYTPKVIRVGPNVHPELASYGLEYKSTARVKALSTSGVAELASVKSELLKEAYIVCATLSVCGSRDMTSFSGVFDTVVIDEASQGVEMATLIPLRLGCRRLVLVGDPRQLPATVFSKVAIEQNYDQSLFQRLERASHKVNMLTIQYRMHPSIALFPSQTFYNNALLDAPNILELAAPPFPWYTIPILRPVVFFSVDSQEQREATSMINMVEVEFVCEILTFLQALFNSLEAPAYSNGKWHNKVAVISPYAEQVRVLRKAVKTQLQVDKSKVCPIDVNTVDGFQGQEKDFVIFSAVRAHRVTEDDLVGGKKKTNVGFLSDVRRMNVALTRARLNLFIVGNGRHLTGNPEWGKFWRFSAAKEFQFHVNFDKIARGNYLCDWLKLYMGRQPAARKLLEQHAPSLVAKITEEFVQAPSTVDSADDSLEESLHQW